MGIILKHSIVFWVIASLTLAGPLGTTAWGQDTLKEEQDTTAGFMTFDLLLVRPTGLAATILGSAVFIVALPFTALTGGTEKSYEKLIKDPAVYTFKRPLGFF
jgi:hypothetical protein